MDYEDEYENNNPFAEPQDISQNIDTSSNHESSITSNDSNQTQTQTKPTQDNDNSEDRIFKTDLKKLLPERFSHKYSISIKLIGIEKNKPENPILKLEAKVHGLPKFRQKEYKELRRTYNEVVKFNKYLSVSNLEVFVPVIPNVNTSYPTGGEDEKKQLMIVWQEWFNRITANPILIRDEEFVYFIENDFGYSVINSNKKSSVASGLMRKTLKQFSIPYDPFEELADFRPTIKNAYLTCQKLHKLLEKNSKCEKQLSIHVYDMSNKLNVLSQFENTHPGMKNMWENLGKVVQIQSDLLLIESINEMAILGDGVQLLINDFYEIKEALTNRYLIMRELIQAEAQTNQKQIQAAKIKNKVSLDPIKVDEALRSLEYAAKVQESLNLQVKRISGEMLYEKDEVAQFTEVKFKNLLKSYVLHKIDHHRKILKNFETIRLDIRCVDEKGGLSRLNRDNLANLKHNLSQSQSNQGDTWSSRTFRSLEKEEASRQHKKESNGPLKPPVVDAKNAATLLGVATF
ncbi:VPS17 [Candida pseudojiufengensis]|uniref:VPS17 n=1 Tax=Candida pseudojiufengensis TaxID=497109 RepID=UPI0022241755|nr:VPS17 [Candida pseudojiufengensis]KAI5966323.1 VPS17 [Candida pseudojiufengensis]